MKASHINTTWVKSLKYVILIFKTFPWKQKMFPWKEVVLDATSLLPGFLHYRSRRMHRGWGQSGPFHAGHSQLKLLSSSTSPRATQEQKSYCSVKKCIMVSDLFRLQHGTYSIMLILLRQCHAWVGIFMVPSVGPIVEHFGAECCEVWGSVGLVECHLTFWSK